MKDRVHAVLVVCVLTGLAGCGGQSPTVNNSTSPPSPPSGGATVSFGSVTVNAPTPGQTVHSPFALTAADTTCEGQPVSTMAYSLDDSSQLFAL
ncbi:MAG TPA: hypothetical protein VJQ54_01490, partial [Candidatus Sulfotelmatobacter sp.]|nr:hypothetical protein [Candidatus Sulfotelmatobacter sp.]